MTVVAPENAVATLVSILSEGKSAKFASVTYRAKGTGELARHLLILNFDVEAIYTKDIETLETQSPVDMQIFYKMFLSDIDYPTFLLAWKEVLHSMKLSLQTGVGNNPFYTHAPMNGDTFIQMDGVKGVKLHKETGVVYILGYSQGKEVIEKGEYKTVNSKDKTICKREIDKMLRRGKIRSFIIKNITRAALNGEVLEIEGEG